MLEVERAQAETEIEDEERQIALLWLEERTRLLPEFKEVEPVKPQENPEAIKLANGKEIEISEVVMLIKDCKGRALFIVDQDPLAKEEIVEGVPKRPILRTPIQASIDELRQLEAGNKQVNTDLYEALRGLSSGGESMGDVIEKNIFSAMSSETSVGLLNTYYGKIKVDSHMAKDLEAITGGMFLSKYQMYVLNQEINGHTHVALSVTNRSKKQNPL